MSGNDGEALRATSATLKSEGYKVAAFLSGKAVVEAARDNPPDLMVLAMGPAAAETRRLCVKLKSDLKTNHIPIILFGQNSHLKKMIDAIDYGADGWLLKPAEPEELLAKVKALVRLGGDKARLLEANAELAALCGLNQELAQAIGLRRVSEVVFAKAKQLLDADRVYLQLLSESGTKATEPLGPGAPELELLRPSKPIAAFGAIINELKSATEPLAVANAKNNSLLAKAFAYGHNLRTVLFLPLRSDGRLIGALLVCRDKISAFSEDQLRVAKVLASAASTAVAVARLVEKSQDLQSTLRAVIEWSDSGLIMVDADRIVRAANRKLGELLQIDHENIIGRHEKDSVVKKAKWLFAEPQAFEERLEWLRGQSTDVVTDHLEMARPTPRSLERFSGPVFDGIGNFMGRVDIYHDVTVRKEHERRIRNLYKRERKIAQILQNNLLPKDAPSLANYDIGTKYSAAVQGMVIGGDYYDFIYLSDDRLAFTIGDVCGKGMAAAVQTYLVKYSLRAFAREDPDPAVVISRLNWIFCQEVEDGAFVTLAYLLLDQAKHRLRYCVAGHPEPLVWRPAKKKFEKLATNGGIVGVVADALYHTKSTRMGAGDVAGFYTDGITEARSDMGFFGEGNLKEIIKAGADCGAQELANMIFAGVSKFSSSNLSDDAAIVVLKRTV